MCIISYVRILREVGSGQQVNSDLNRLFRDFVLSHFSSISEDMVVSCTLKLGSLWGPLEKGKREERFAQCLTACLESALVTSFHFPLIEAQ